MSDHGAAQAGRWGSRGVNPEQAHSRLGRPTFLRRVADAFASISDRVAVQGSDPYLSDLPPVTAVSLGPNPSEARRPKSRKSQPAMILAAAQADLREFAAGRWPAMNAKGRMRELSRLLPWTARRVRSIYNAETGVSVRATERADIDGLTKTDEANRDDFQALQARVARLEAALLASDAERHQSQLAARREADDGGRRGHVAGSARSDHD